MEEPLPLRHVSQALYCPRKLYLQEVLSLSERTGYAETKRSILQEALRYTNKAEPGIVKGLKDPTRQEEVEDKYYDNARRSLQEALLNHRERLREHDASIIETHKMVWQELKPYVKARVRNTHAYATANRTQGNELWWDLMPKITYCLEVSSAALGIKMTIDRVDNYPHHATPYLYKHQRPPTEGIWHNHRHELAAAIIILAEQGLVAQEGVIAYDGGAQERRLEMAAELEEQLKAAVVRTKEVLVRWELPRRVENTRKCESCPHKERCYDDVYMRARQQETVGKIAF